MKAKGFLIAEVGINHNGSLELAKRLIAAAQEAGADAAKLQLYNPNKVFGHSGSHPDPIAFAWALRCELTRQMFEELWRFAELIGFPLSASVFDFDRFQWLAELGPPFYKIASRTAATDPLLTRAVISTGVPTLISDGFGWAEEYRGANVKRLFCVSEYPATNVVLPKFGIEDGYSGYSDHTIGTAKAIEAIGRGARVIEVHFTFDHGLKGPDHVLSKTPEELAQIVQAARSL